MESLFIRLPSFSAIKEVFDVVQKLLLGLAEIVCIASNIFDRFFRKEGRSREIESGCFMM